MRGNVLHEYFFALSQSKILTYMHGIDPAIDNLDVSYNLIGYAVDITDPKRRVLPIRFRYVLIVICRLSGIDAL